MIALLMLSGLAAAADVDLDGAIRAAPAPVRAFIQRRDECEHWGGEEPYDKARRREIEAAVRDLRCTALDRDEAALKRRYAARPDLIDLMERAANRPL